MLPGAQSKAAPKTLVVAAALLAIAPDLDFLFVWVLRMGPGWHRGFAHSLAFSAVMASLVAVGFNAEWRKAFAVLWAAMGSHCLVDALTSKLAPGPELFWPFSSRRYNAGFFDYLDFSIRVRGPFEFLVFIVKISAVEALIFIPLFLMVGLIANRVASQRSPETAVEQQKIG